jgi:hypothetical protein
MLPLEVHLAVFDGNSWSLIEGSFCMADAEAEIPVALRVYGGVLQCVVVEPGGTGLAVYALDVDLLQAKPNPRLDPPPGATRLHGVALTGSDLYVVAEVHGKEGLYAISMTGYEQSWDEIDPGSTDCRRSIGTAC